MECLHNGETGLNSSFARGATDNSVRRETQSDERLKTLEVKGSWRYERNGRWMPSVEGGHRLVRGHSDGMDVDTSGSSFLRRELTLSGMSRRQSTWAKLKMSGIPRNEAGRTLRWNAECSETMRKEVKRNLVWDAYDRSAPEPDVTQSYDYTWNLLEHALRGGLQYSAGRRDFQLSVAGTLKVQRDEERYLSGIPVTKNRYWSLCPSLSYKSPHLELTFDTGTDVPSVEQLRPWLDTRNPLLLRSGNPALGQTWRLRGGVQWHSDPAVRGNIWTLGIQLSPEFNPVVTRRAYFSTDTELPEYGGYVARAGSMLTSYRQSDFAFRGQLRSQWDGRLPKWHSRVRAGLEYRYMGLPQYVGGQLLHLNDHIPGANLLWLYDYRWLKCSVHTLVRYHSASNDAGGTILKAVDYEGSCMANVYFGKSRSFFHIQYNLSGNSFLKGNYRNWTDHLLHVTLTYNIRRSSPRASVSLIGYNLLAKNQVYHRSISADSVTESWRYMAGRMYLVRLSFMFRTNGQPVRTPPGVY